jgi:peptide/nickel transport system substrate-binding protein
MSKKILWLVLSEFMVLSLVLAACGPSPGPIVPTSPTEPVIPTSPVTPGDPATPIAPVSETPQQQAAKPAPETPTYGGTLVLTQNANMADWTQGHTVSWNFLFDTIFGGDWTKGTAGGFGTGESDWTSNYDRFDHYLGYAADSYKWNIDAARNSLTIVYQIRQGIRYHVIPGNPYSAKANGREMTADDVAWTLNWQTHTPTMYMYVTVPELRTANITKTAPWEVTVTLTGAEMLMPAITNLNGKYSLVRPPEVFEGNFNKWQQQIGTGPFMLKEYIPDSQGTVVKNPNYWAKDPVGPGKGNQLPYLDAVKYIIIPDASTRQAALRTGKIDQLFDFKLDDANMMRKTTPQLKELEYYGWNTTSPSVHMRVDIPPFNDIRVRQAMMFATDFEGIRKGLNQSKGIIQTYPFMYNKAYADLWIAHDDPAMPQKVKDLYTYNPDKAKQMLKEAGFPNGFKMDILALSTEVDYLSILKDMWAKVGVDLQLMVRDSTTRTSMINNKQHPPMATGSSNSVGRFYQPWTLTGETSTWNVSGVKDPVINEELNKVRTLAQTDLVGAMHLMRDFTKDHILYQAYAVPAPSAPVYAFWWPWVKNYNGELVMLLGTYTRWAQWVWIDQDLKKSMGY